MTGRVYIITGASSGIGKALAVAAAAAGESVVLAARNPTTLQAAADEAAAAGGATLAVPTDVTERAQVEALVRAAADRFGRVDVLINNAGVATYGLAVESIVDDLRRVMEVNYFGALHCIQAVVPLMQQQGSGRIVNISGAGGKRALPLIGGYAASKFAISALTDALRVELASLGIGVTLVYPPLTKTPLADHALAGQEYGALFHSAGGAEAADVAQQMLASINAGEREAMLGGPTMQQFFEQSFRDPEKVDQQQQSLLQSRLKRVKRG